MIIMYSFSNNIYMLGLEMIKQLTMLPKPEQLETRAVLKQLVTAHRYLAELKGVASTIPNPEILISTLSLQEAKDSSEIENIFTTQDELFQADISSDSSRNAAAKEVRRYAAALRSGFEKMRGDQLITVNRIVEFHQTLMGSDAGLRKLPGTIIKNLTTGETVFTPPSHTTSLRAFTRFMMATEGPGGYSTVFTSLLEACWINPCFISAAISSIRKLTTTASCKAPERQTTGNRGCCI